MMRRHRPGQTLSVLLRALVAESDFAGDQRGSLQSHGGSTDEDSFNFFVVERANGAFQVHGG